MLGKRRCTLGQLLVPLLLGMVIVCGGSDAWAQTQPQPESLEVAWGQRKSITMGNTIQIPNDVQVSDPTVCDVQVTTESSTSQSLVITGKQLGVATVLVKLGTSTQITEYRILVTLDKTRVKRILAMLKLDDVNSHSWFTPDGDKVVLDGVAPDEATVQTAIHLITGPRFPESAIVNHVSVYWPYTMPTCCARSCYRCRRL